MGTATARKLSERQRIQRLEQTLQAIMNEIPERVAIAIARSLKPLRLELDLISLIIKDKLKLTSEETDEFRKRLLVMHMHLEAAASIGYGLSTYGKHPIIQQLVFKYADAFAAACLHTEEDAPDESPALSESENAAVV